ncbi:hypothetical protein BH18ACT3_BH18ACT3_09030 [soil metagenome]|jgi:hypothetical protein
MKKLLFLLGAGAAAAYFLDPDNGNRRRTDAKTTLDSFGRPTRSASPTA